MKFHITTITGKKRMVGELLDDSTFVKQVQYSKHHFHRAGGWGIDASVFEKLKANGCKKIVLKDSEQGKTWEATFEMFDVKKWTHTFPKFQEQCFLADDRWNVYRFNEKIQEAKPIEVSNLVEEKKEAEVAAPKTQTLF